MKFPQTRSSIKDQLFFIVYYNDKVRVEGGEVEGVTKDKKLKLEEIAASLTLGGAGEGRVQGRGKWRDACCCAKKKGKEFCFPCLHITLTTPNFVEDGKKLCCPRTRRSQMGRSAHN